LHTAIINIDDAFGCELQRSLIDKPYRLLTYSRQARDADIFASQVNYSNQGMRANIQTPWGCGELCSSLLGAFNLSNLLAVVGAACVQNVKLETVLSLLPQLKSTAGRMQSVALSVDQDISVVIDFAHTPDALKNTLQALRTQTKGKLICVFGCGGDRDVGKRALMGATAANLADSVILTSDNPRSENPQKIVADIVVGIDKPLDGVDKKNANVLIKLDRGQAISLAIAKAYAGDTVLIAGKGHETEQIFSDYSEFFSDSEQAESALNLRLSGGGL